MKKIVLKFLTFIIISLLFLQVKPQIASAITIFTSGGYSYTVIDGNATIMDYTGSETDITIPSTIDGYTVTQIGYNGFNGSKLKSVIIPDSVIRIGNYAFIYSDIENVTIGKNVTHIGSHAFQDCNLTKVTIPHSVILIGMYAFYQCNGLAEVKFLGNAPILGYKAFWYDKEFEFEGNLIKVYYLTGNTGFTNPWHGYPTEPFGFAAYNVTYNGNGSTKGTVPMDSKTYLVGEKVTVAGNTGSLSKTNYTFLGWNTKIDGTGINYVAADTFNIGTADSILYANWRINKCTVTFNTNGGSAIASQSVNYNGKAIKPTNLTKAAYTFVGWYKESTFTNLFDFANTPITDNITLYAKWLPSPTNLKVESAGYTSIKTSWGAVSGKPILNIPTSVTASSSGGTSIDISWSAVTGASGYAIYRTTSSTGPYSFVGTTTSTIFKNTNLATGTTYYYKIKAYRIVGDTMVFSNYSAVTSAKPMLSNLTNFAAVRLNSTTAKLTWNKVIGASGYQIYKATSLSGSGASLINTTSLSYINTGLTTGKSYYYKVRPYTIVGKTKVYGHWTKIVYIKP